MRRKKSGTRHAAELSAGVTTADDAEIPQEAEPEPEPEPEAAAVEPELREPPAGSSQNEEVDYWRDIVLSEPANVMARRRLARALAARGQAML
ncbi:MAG: hypothetical protein WD054_02885, partial [Gemmatimonadota bacterium]